MAATFQFHRTDAGGVRISIPNAVTCKLCGSDSLKQAYDLGACALLECRACGFRFIDFLDSDSASAKVIDEATIAKTAKAIESGLESNHDRIASCIDLVKSHVSEGPVLDVGAGGGAFLARISVLFPGSEGIDLHPVLYEICRRAGLQISREPLESAQWDGRRGAFGAVSMWDVIEHVNDPLAMCKKAWQLLREGGVLLLDTPTRDGLLYGVGEMTAMFSRGRYLTTLGIQYSSNRFGHKQIFRKVDMRRMLADAGFRSVVITEKKELSFPVRFYLQPLLKSRTLVRILEPVAAALLRLAMFKNKMIVVAMK
jgi:2-polyprenyl-3-methyl-5-hydroxy-6-metoxy-1,4-benzoquinol methylase